MISQWIDRLHTIVKCCKIEIGSTKVNLFPCKGHSLGGMFIGINNVLFTGDEFIFELTLRTNTHQIQASKQILNNSISNDNYNLTVPYFGTFLNDTAIKSLMSTGLIEGYDNQELITDLLKYYRNDYDFVKDQSEGDEKLMFQRLEYVTKNFEIDSVSLNKKSNFGDLNMPYFYLSKEVLSKLQKDKIYRSFLNNIIYIKIAYNNFVGSALKKNR